jgi:hypothetical protein
MTDFFDSIINSANQSQSDRLRSQSAKKKRDKLLNPFATYQGIDLIDGTDRVAINGETNSGFKLISNAPLSIGERVYLRQNISGGLQRVDTRNRLVESVKPTILIPSKPIIFPDPTSSIDVQLNFTYDDGNQSQGWNRSWYYPTATETAYLDPPLDTTSIVLNIVWGDARMDWDILIHGFLITGFSFNINPVLYCDVGVSTDYSWFRYWEWDMVVSPGSGFSDSGTHTDSGSSTSGGVSGIVSAADGSILSGGFSGTGAGNEVTFIASGYSTITI